MNTMYRVLQAAKLDPVFREKLEEKGFQVDVKPGIGRRELLEVIGGYDVLVVRSRPIVDRELLQRGRRGRLRLVVRAGVGLDNIDLEAARELGVAVENTPGASTQSVAELVLGLMVSVTRNLVLLHNRVSSGEWSIEYGYELAGKTLAIIGFGRIGRRVAALARAIGMKVVAHDILDLEKEARALGAEFTGDLCTALRRGHIVSLHVPLTPLTRHMINKETLECFKRGAILINASRGPVVDSQALLEALENGALAGAGLDVLEHEPPETEAEKKLLKHPRVVATPHIGASTREAQRRVAVAAALKVLRILGECPIRIPVRLKREKPIRESVGL